MPAIANCNCDFSCPCQFNSLPTHGDCRAMTALRIDKGHFGDVDLSGVTWCGMFAWPKAIHEGNGEAFAVMVGLITSSIHPRTPPRRTYT